MKDDMNIAAWKVMEKYYKAGKAKVIGVSNYNKRQLDVLLENAELVPAVNQFHIDPITNMQDQINYCMSKGIYTQAASPFGGTGRTKGILEHPVIVALAEEMGKTTAQIVIRWNLQKGVIMIPKSVHKERIASNLDVFGFELNAWEMAIMDSVNDPSAGGPFGNSELAYFRFSGRMKMSPPKHD
jgi:diketogulonate reductase-like aldo/keto reductase